MNTDKPFIIIGAGGHAKVVIDLIQSCGGTIKGIVDSDKTLWGSALLGLPILGGDDLILEHDTNDIVLANGIGTAAKRGDTGLDIRTRIYNDFTAKTYNFPALIHPASTISGHAEIKGGAQIMAGSIVQVSAIIGENTIINTRASIDHDSTIGAHSHIAPGATICGTVNIGEGVYVGAGTVIFQGVNAPDNIVISGGATIRKSSDLA